MNVSANAPDAVVIGGGVIGCAIAWELARRGLNVTVVERGTPGREATWAAGGMLSPLAEAGTPGPFLELGLASLDRYPAYAEAVRDASGLDVEYLASGKLQIALDQQGAEELEGRYAWQRNAGFAVERLHGDDARRLEPALSPAVRAALFIPRDHQVNNRRLGRALWLAAAHAGTAFRLGVPATAIRATIHRSATEEPRQIAMGKGDDVAAGERRQGATAMSDRVVAVVLADGTELATGQVIVAAGCWSGQLRGLPRPLPVAPVRGQMIAVQTVPPTLTRVVLNTRPHCYFIPRSSGRVLVGATVEAAGFHDHPTPAGVGSLLTATVRAVPPLADAPLVESWSGLRPGTPDDLPILGPDPELDGLFYATGHFRNGILLAPITAEVMADLITGATPAVALNGFAAGRFPVPEAR